MGIYSNGKIFGIRIYVFNDESDISNILFERKYDSVMNNTQKKEAYTFYANLSNKRNLLFRTYDECSSSHELQNRGSFMMWNPISLNQFLDTFDV
jgi:hypothetical protein